MLLFLPKTPSKKGKVGTLIFQANTGVWTLGLSVSIQDLGLLTKNSGSSAEAINHCIFWLGPGQHFHFS